MSDIFPWFFYKTSTWGVESKEYKDAPFFSHQFLCRPSWPVKTDKIDIKPTKRYPEPQSSLLAHCHDVLEEIIEYNSLRVNSFMRINANCTMPETNPKLSVPHEDHQFDHSNLLLYLTDAGGETVVFEEDETGERKVFDPEEDDIVFFKGLHCMRPPTTKPRIVIVATFI